MSCWLSDMISRIRVGLLNRHKQVRVVFTIKNYRFLEILSVLGLIEGFFVLNAVELVVQLKYSGNKSIIQRIYVCSTPGRRKYLKVKDLSNLYPNEILIISTSQGLLTRDEAVIKNLGGELLCRIV
jgi:small subunit ribosomal protein S8